MVLLCDLLVFISMHLCLDFLQCYGSHMYLSSHIFIYLLTFYYFKAIHFSLIYLLFSKAIHGKNDTSETTLKKEANV